MIEIKGKFYNKNIIIQSEDEDCCALIQNKILSEFMLESKSGCPKDCKYILNPGEKEKFFICDVRKKKEDHEKAMKKITNAMKFSPLDRKLIQEWRSFSEDWDAGWLIIVENHVNIFIEEWLNKKDRKLFTIAELFDRDEDDYNLWKMDLPILKRRMLEHHVRTSC